MPTLTPIPLAVQREERWANGTGTTRVILREPDSDRWRLRASIAHVDAKGSFSEMPGTRRTLIPLDAPMALQFRDGHMRRIRRLQALRFAGAPAPVAHLPAGPTRDFNLMLRGDARGELVARPLVDSMALPAEPGSGWLLYLDSGRATVHTGDHDPCVLESGDAVRVGGDTDPLSRAVIEGAGEILLVKLYA